MTLTVDVSLQLNGGKKPGLLASVQPSPLPVSVLTFPGSVYFFPFSKPQPTFHFGTHWGKGPTATHHVDGGSRDSDRHVTASHAKRRLGERRGGSGSRGRSRETPPSPSAHVTGGRGAAHVTGAAGRRVPSVPAPQLRGLSSRWTRPPAGLATAAPRPRLRRAMAASGARRPLLLLLLGEPWEGGRAGRGRRLGTDGKGAPGRLGTGRPGRGRRAGLEPPAGPALTLAVSEPGRALGRECALGAQPAPLETLEFPVGSAAGTRATL